jgi:pimeloyl-ACP methyl ester carboxylesterase
MSSHCSTTSIPRAVVVGSSMGGLVAGGVDDTALDRLHDQERSER